MKYRRYRRAKRRPRVTLRSKLKQERSKRVKISFFLILIVSILSFSGYWVWNWGSEFIFSSEHFKIQEIEVNGTYSVGKSEIIALLPFRKGDNLLTIDTSKAKKLIREYKKELKGVNVNRRWQKIVIDIEERKPIACIAIEDRFFGIDRDNNPFPIRGAFSEWKLPEIEASNDNERKKIIDFILVLKKQAKDFLTGVQGFRLEPVDNIVMRLNDGTEVYWGAYEKIKMKSKLKVLKSVLKDSRKNYRKIEYINLAFHDDGRVLVKPFEDSN